MHLINFFDLIKTSRFKYVFIFYFICLFENNLIRLILTLRDFSGLSSPVVDVVKICLMGLVNDTINFSYVGIFIVLYLWLIPEKFFKTKWQFFLAKIFTFLVILFFCFQAFSEWFFWNEFSSRFNFIAVDYLVYTKEVLGNIQESYPMHLIYSSIVIISSLLFISIFKILKNTYSNIKKTNFIERSKIAFCFLCIPFFSFFFFENFGRIISDNPIVNELSYNGLYQLFHAYRHNELDYYSFYKTLDDKSVWKNMSTFLESKKIKSEITNKGLSLYRKVKSDGPEKRLNVMYVVVESLAASFMKEFGNKQNITPFLDKLTGKSLFFTNLYATGTRTIRGMEALTLSIPPTPGYSIVKRPQNDNLFSVGKIFKDRGYDTKFIYGGYGYFDNMNSFFGGNYFDIVDRTQFKNDEYQMANIWGVDDESLFKKAIKEADQSYNDKKSFFSFVMTTSNHRPYTYPEGKIDIPSHTSREGAVKYTDYSIHKLLEEAEKKPWFQDTIFIIVADHGVGGRGTTEIPMEQFHIPLFIYSPSHIQPQKIKRLASQIDVIPTVLALLNFSYVSKFFGKNILEMTEDEERAVLGTYSSLGYYTKGTLVTLGINKNYSFVGFDQVNRKVDYSKKSENPKALEEAISYYQQASYIWSHGLLKSTSEVKPDLNK